MAECLAKECGLCTGGIEEPWKGCEQRGDMMTGHWEAECDGCVQEDRTGASQEVASMHNLELNSILVLWF